MKKVRSSPKTDEEWLKSVGQRFNTPARLVVVFAVVGFVVVVVIAAVAVVFVVVAYCNVRYSSIQNIFRFHKAVQHLREREQLKGNQKDIGALVNELDEDFEKEYSQVLEWEYS